MIRSYPWRPALALATVVCLTNGLAQAQSIGGTVVTPPAVIIFLTGMIG
jgi:hypothetical protein